MTISIPAWLLWTLGVAAVIVVPLAIVALSGLIMLARVGGAFMQGVTRR